MRFKTGSLDLNRINGINEGLVIVCFMMIYIGFFGTSIFVEKSPLFGLTYKTLMLGVTYIFLLEASIQAWLNKIHSSWIQIYHETIDPRDNTCDDILSLCLLFKFASHSFPRKIFELYFRYSICQNNSDMIRTS